MPCGDGSVNVKSGEVRAWKRFKYKKYLRLDVFFESRNENNMSENNISKKRIRWIDALKGLGILYVTIGHLNPWLPIETHIYSFHMCLFFFISGYLFNQEQSLHKFINKKFCSILVPFIVWDFLASIVSIIRGQSFQETVSTFFIINGQVCWNAPIWFLLILFFAEVLYAAVMKYNNSIVTSAAIVVVFTILWIVIGANRLPMMINLLPLALLFYALGDIVHKTFNENINPPIAFLITFGLVSIVFGTILNERISYTGAFWGNIYYCIPAAVAGTLFYFLIFSKWKWMEQCKILCALGNNSLIIMATQYWFFRGYDIISKKLFNISVWHTRSTIKAIVISCVTIFFIMFGVYFFKKIFEKNKVIMRLSKYIGIR